MALSLILGLYTYGIMAYHGFTCNPIGCGLYWTRFELNHYFQFLNRLGGCCHSALCRPMNRQ